MTHLTSFEVVLTIVSAIFFVKGIIRFIKMYIYD